MTNTNPNKQYGLIVPNRNKGHQIGQITSKPSIFNEDSDSDNPITKPTGLSKGIKKQDKIDQEKAIEDDPTVYQYDEIYDEMDKKRKESKLSRKDLDRKPKYINRLLAAAEKRKRENERRIERQVQKEREEEGEMFKDKESFITSAYKKKLEEMRELEEQEKREEYLENIGDVRKQGNLDGFYRHLYDQKLNYEDKADDDQEPAIKEEPKSDSESTKRKSLESEESSSTIRKKRKSSASESNINRAEEGRETNQRKYRARRHSEESEKSEDEIEVKKEHLPSNLDADSDFSIDSSDSEEEKENGDKNTSKKDKNSEDNKDILKEKTIEEMKEVELDDGKVVKPESIEKKVKQEPEEIKVKPKPKVDIWKKVTVGEKFDEALKRYFERKAQREAEGKSF